MGDMKWIKVEVGSPNMTTLDGKKVLVVMNGDIHLVIVDNFLDSEEEEGHLDKRLGKATHWMPLPPLPE